MSKEKLRKRASDLQRKYGMSTVDYLALAAAQGNRCAICGDHPEDGERLAVDHSHGTKRVRGLLCRTCNGALGMFRDSPRLLSQALVYVVRHLEGP